MRRLVAILFFMITACAPPAQEEGGGYDVTVFASGRHQLVVVTAPDGRSAAAQASGESSALLPWEETRMAVRAVERFERQDEDNPVRFEAPGVRVRASEEKQRKPEGGADPASLTLELGNLGFNLTADDRHALVQTRLRELSESNARRFILDADRLSPAVRDQMLGALRLPRLEQHDNPG